MLVVVLCLPVKQSCIEGIGGRNSFVKGLVSVVAEEQRVDIISH